MHVEHIFPNGGNELDNLCLSCSSCNLSKSIAISEIDPETGASVTLFHPRQQTWQEHFEWVDSGLRLYGKTPTGRATIIRLKMNQDRLVRARRNWIATDNHPPSTTSSGDHDSL